MIQHLADKGIWYSGTREERGVLQAQEATGMRGSAAVETHNAAVLLQNEAGEKHLRERCSSACIHEQMDMETIPAE